MPKGEHETLLRKGSAPRRAAFLEGTSRLNPFEYYTFAMSPDSLVKSRRTETTRKSSSPFRIPFILRMLMNDCVFLAPAILTISNFYTESDLKTAL